jgi:hypothetical protein
LVTLGGKMIRLKLKLILPAIILVGGLVVPSTVSFGKAEYTKKEKKACSFCHSQGKEFNKVGECYKKNHSLEGCEAK